MLIGKDFPKIEWQPFGLDLVEPNAMIGDTLILICALFFAYKTARIAQQNVFFIWWKRFFVLFGISFFMGGIGHLCFNYFGVPGKYASWYLGIVASYCIEMAMLSLYPFLATKKHLITTAKIKMGIALTVTTLVFCFVDLTIDPQKGLLVPTLNSIIGLGLTMGALGYYYSKRISSSFRYLWLSTFILIPSAIVQSLKINIHPWFDRNDISHLLLLISLFMYYKCIQGVARDESTNNSQIA